MPASISTALLAIPSAREETNVESESSIWIDAGPKGNSMAPGNAGLIGSKKDPADGKAQKRAVTLKLFATTMELVRLRGKVDQCHQEREQARGQGGGQKGQVKADRANAAKIELAQRPGGAEGSGGMLGRADLRVVLDAAAVERRGWVKVGGRASSRNYLQLLLVPPCVRTPFISLRLR